LHEGADGLAEDLRFMEAALALAREARERQEVPVGAVVAMDGGAVATTSGGGTGVAGRGCAGVGCTDATIGGSTGSIGGYSMNGEGTWTRSGSYCSSSVMGVSGAVAQAASKAHALAA